MDRISLQSQIAIIGAGIGGLSSALALAKKGARNIRIFERRNEFGEIGAGMQLGPNASKILCKWGLADQIEEIADRFPIGHLYSGTTNKKIATLPMDARALKRHGFHSYQVLRSDFHNMLLQTLIATLGKNPIEYGKALAKVSNEERQPRLTFDDCSNYSADLVIASDGVKSKTRRLIGLDDSELSYSGYYAWRGLLPANKLSSEISLEGPRVWVGDGKHLVAYRVGRGRYINLVGISEAGRWAGESSVEDAASSDWLRDYEDWRHPSPANPLSLIEPLQSCQKWALFSLPAMPKWNKEAVGLVGDAAHPMMPSLAQGAAQAMEDADMLADLISDSAETNAEQLWERFFSLRNQRVERVQKTSLWNLRYFHRRKSLFSTLQHGGMRLGGRLTTEVIARRNDWVFS